VAHAEVRSELLLERLDLGTEDVDAALDDLRQTLDDLLAESEQRGLGIEQTGPRTLKCSVPLIISRGAASAN
jgi:hypothetical protein